MHRKIISIPFFKPDYGEREKSMISDIMMSGFLEGGGIMNQRCEQDLIKYANTADSMIVPSCTAALEIMALALNLKPGDEIIMPSYTFVSTANAFALRGAVPVFVDIDERTLNIDPNKAEAAITEKTRAIVLVHYAGVACDIPKFIQICKAHDLVLLEDAAQAIDSYWGNRPLGSFGSFGAVSFHHTKNLTCGEGGALLVNDKNFVGFSRRIRDKGTDRSDYLKRTIDRYQWQCLGSSYLLSELNAAVLAIQLKRMKEITEPRRLRWNQYYAQTSELKGIKIPFIPAKAKHNAHIFHIRLSSQQSRDALIKRMRMKGIVASSHYVPLHLTPGGKKYGRQSGNLDITTEVCNTIIRLPLYSTMTEQEQDLVMKELKSFLPE